jgi:hypothetical protein
MLELKRLSFFLSKEENVAVEVYGGRRGKSAHLALAWSELFVVISWSPNVRLTGQVTAFLSGIECLVFIS